MIHPTIRRTIAERYHRALPEEIRDYLKGRGIPATLIERHLLGWNGERITIPVFNEKRDVIAFRYAKITGNPDEAPDVISELGFETELYGWDTLARKPHRVVICGSEFDRLVLEANGLAAVASTGGPGAFLEEWLPHFEAVKHVYVCFSRDLEGAAAARKIQRLLPRVRIVTLPTEVGDKGSVTNFLVDLGRTRVDFEVLLAVSEGSTGDAAPPPKITELRPLHRSVQKRADRVRRAVRLHEIVSNDIDLQASGGRLIGQCPFHDDASRSFSLYPETDTYRCGVCGAEGDVVRFLMDKESMTFGQALDALERYEYTHEIYGTS